jgi:hypothetical protein
MFEYKPDFEATMQRMNAFWERELIDRPLVQFLGLQKPLEQRVAVPHSHHASPDERWLDVDYQVALTEANLANGEYPGDTLPLALPLLGPEIFGAFYGCPLHYSNYDTCWSEPILQDWSQLDTLHLDWNNFYFKRLTALSDALVEAGQGKWITGMSDWHVGADALAALRDPQRLAMDMIQYPEGVKTLLARVNADYFAVYDFFYDRLRKAGLPITSWTPLVAESKYYILQCDFSIMVSQAMYREFFLDGLRGECQFLDRSIYHLDGPGALRHLDDILAIPELDALQWVPGAGNEDFNRWIWVYQKAQKAGKGIQVNCKTEEIEAIMANLDPRGLYLIVMDCPSRQTAEMIINRLEKWTVRK